MALRILVAEDEEITLNNIIDTFREEGYSAEGTRDGVEALEKAEKGQYDVVITDIKMPRMDGIELMEKVKAKYPDSEVLIITGYGSVSSAVEAMKKGAFDYITKPFDLDDLVIRVKKIEQMKMLKLENIALRTYFDIDKKITVIAKSDSMKEVLNTIENVKDSDSNVLLTGETGVGKSLIAKAMHFTSKRMSRPFLSLNCATFTEELLSSELFGHEKGAFTGAIAEKRGLVEIADTGTLFLDEITELTPSLQAKLLKVVDEGEFYRVGGTKPLKVDVRFISATNQNLKALISEGRFREDLYYRLNIIEIFISPLRDRKEDIKPLSAHFLQKHLPESNKKIKGFTEEAMEILQSYSFPGNIRELENIVERAIIIEKGPLITPESLPYGIRELLVETLDPGKIKTVDNVVREHAEKVVKMLGGNKSKAAKLLGISRTSLWKILRED